MIDANDYSKALYELAQEEGRQEAILEQMRTVRALFQQEPDYVTLLDTPALSKEQRIGLLDASFQSLDPYLLNFLKILCEKHGIRQYAACADGYEAYYDKAHDILRATAITAAPMTQMQTDALKRKLEHMTKKTVVLRNVIDPDVLGGVTLRFGGLQFDGSLQSRLDELRQALKSAIV